MIHRLGDPRQIIVHSDEKQLIQAHFKVVDSVFWRVSILEGGGVTHIGESFTQYRN